MVFVGFVFMTLLDLGLLVLFGVQHPNCADAAAGMPESQGNNGCRCVMMAGSI